MDRNSEHTSLRRAKRHGGVEPFGVWECRKGSPASHIPNCRPLSRACGQGTAIGTEGDTLCLGGGEGGCVVRIGREAHDIAVSLCGWGDMERLNTQERGDVSELIGWCRIHQAVRRGGELTRDRDPATAYGDDAGGNCGDQ
jgi:hypothetical protein